MLKRQSKPIYFNAKLVTEPRLCCVEWAVISSMTWIFLSVFIFCTLSTPLSYLFRKILNFSIFCSLILINLFPWPWPLPIVKKELAVLKHSKASFSLSPRTTGSHVWHKHGKQINIRNTTLEVGGVLESSVVYREILFMEQSYYSSSEFQSLSNFAGNQY